MSLLPRILPWITLSLLVILPEYLPISRVGILPSGLSLRDSIGLVDRAIVSKPICIGCGVRLYRVLRVLPLFPSNPHRIREDRANLRTWFTSI